MMNDLTLPHDAKLEEGEGSPYAFAADDKGSPRFELKSSSKKSSRLDQQNNSYEEIQTTRSRVKGSNAYETIDLVFGTRTISESNDSNEPAQDATPGKEYRFATEMPSVGVPEPFGSSRTSSQVSEMPSDSLNGDEENATEPSTGHSDETGSTASANGVLNDTDSIASSSSDANKKDVTTPPNGNANAVQDVEKHIYNSVRSYSIKSEEKESHYQSPGSLFPTKDKFFPNGTADSGDFYATPRKLEQNH